jgi:hypothetical protein
MGEFGEREIFLLGNGAEESHNKCLERTNKNHWPFLTMIGNEDFMVHAQLNDVGVSLLQQNCFFQAFDTFRDAMKAIRADFHNGGDSKNTSSIPDANSVLQRAKARLLSLEPYPFPPSTKVNAILAQDLITAQDIDSVLELLNQGNPHESLVAIRADRAKCGDKLHSHVRKDVSAALVIYNLGIAHRVYATTLEKQDNLPGASKEHWRAAELLTLSDTILEKESYSATGKEGASGNLRRILLIRMVVLLALNPEKVQEKVSCVHFQLSALCHRSPKPRGPPRFPAA